MFDFAWSEILLIGAVALIAIGPKDMPAAIRTISSMIKKARRMAAEFQTHVDEMVREADLGDVKKAFHEVRNFDLSGAMEKVVDPDRGLRNTFATNPLEPAHPKPQEVSTLEEVTVEARPVIDPVALAEIELPPAKPDSPAWIPPSLVPTPPVPTKAASGPAEEPPAWLPPAAVAPRHDRL
jgi:sec-independent protein translocase protein TatB